ncbi:Subtilase family protein [Duganella sp. CF517]|uniref:S8 family serine peptidase n=1 Tax=Duganella sp. CF517 TaxID=1881038 RepID=UPI0008D16BB9|nr:S8 family serine peptidase [Duganella sp. CF517]SEN22515.1 Subtilase family protein [Duganella sp. CF517]
MPKNPNGGAPMPPESTSSGGETAASTEGRGGGRGAAASGATGGPAPGGAAAGTSAAGGSGGGDDAAGAAAGPATTAPAGAVDGNAARAADSRADSVGRAIGSRKKQYVVAPRQVPEGLHTLGFQPLQFSALEQALRNSADIEVVDTVGPKSVLGALADGMGGSQGVLVARMTEQKAALLHQQGQGRLLVEHDQHLTLMEPALRQPQMVTGVMPGAGGPVVNAVISVVGKDGAPQADAEVSLFGGMMPASGKTDANGQVTLSLFGETPESITGLYVKPKADYWSFYQRDPDISTDEANVVALRALSDWPALAGFPRQRALGWGQKAMRLDQLPGAYRGQGIKIAVVDSGAATSHDNLHGIKAGFDVLNKKTNPAGWDQDAMGHGTHCAGVIAAADITSGIRGFAPEAEVHACKLFPGGQVSQLIDALEYCIDQQIDVVNLSLGGAEVSEALEQQILRAKRAGIACIVAAGNSGGPVQYPASSPNVLAVAAIGKLDEFPADSYHAQTLDANVDAYGYFTAKFSCFGPQVGVCGPGVAITSCVPPNNFAAWDGTSMATPHITGLAALTLAHHPDFQTPQYKVRGAERVERLFQIIRASARRVSLADQSRTGFGMPDVLVAVGLQTPSGQALQQPAVTPQALAMQQPLIAGMMAPQGMLSPFMAGAAPGMEPFGLELARAPWHIPRSGPWYQISPTMPPQYPTFHW